MGLLWSQHLVAAGSSGIERTVSTLIVSAGTRRLASALLTQLFQRNGVEERAETVSKTGFVGDYFAPAGGARHPAVVVWGGSEGGLSPGRAWAALLASHGIPALALAYFDEPGLPCALSNVPLEYFVNAIGWLRRQPQVDRGRVWLLSGSRGSEAELLVADHWPDLVHGLVAESPSSIGYGATPGECSPSGPVAWTLRGAPVPYDDLVLRGAITYNRDGALSEVSAFQDGLGLPSAAAAHIPLAGIEGPVLLISGGDDQLWPSNVYARQIIEGLKADRFIHRHLNYPAAGHIVLAVPYEPTGTEERTARATIALGGSPAGNEAAHESAWPATISFIADH